VIAQRGAIARGMPVAFPAHPRTRKLIATPRPQDAVAPHRVGSRP
jgi:hypothetical protein